MATLDVSLLTFQKLLINYCIINGYPTRLALWLFWVTSYCYSLLYSTNECCCCCCCYVWTGPKGNHVKFARFVLLGVSEEAKKFSASIFSVQCIIKQLLDSVFVISRKIEVSVRVISLSLRIRLITTTSTSIILDITKTSSNNCF